MISFIGVNIRFLDIRKFQTIENGELRAEKRFEGNLIQEICDLLQCADKATPLISAITWAGEPHYDIYGFNENGEELCYNCTWGPFLWVDGNFDEAKDGWHLLLKADELFALLEEILADVKTQHREIIKPARFVTVKERKRVIKAK